MGSLLIFIGAIIVIIISARWNWWRLPQPGIPILMYHKIGTPPQGSKLKKLWVSQNMFEQQMRYLKEKKYQSVAFEDIVAGKPMPQKPVVITFDDGYENNFIQALPVLSSYGFKAIFFIVSDGIGKDNFWHDPDTEIRIPMMKKEQLNALVDQGHEIGAHTVSHKNLEKINRDQWENEIVSSKKTIEESIQKRIVSFAHPYGGGAFITQIQELLAAANFSCACTIKQGKALFQKNPYALKRLFIRGDDTLFDFYLQLTRGKSRF